MIRFLIRPGYGFHTLTFASPSAGACWRRVAVHLLPPLPPLLPTEPIPTDWFLTSRAPLDGLREELERIHSRRVTRLLHLASHGGRSLWWPFTQHRLVEGEDVTVIDSRAGSRFSVLKVRPGWQARSHVANTFLSDGMG